MRLLALIFALVISASSFTEKRVTLVIGNSADGTGIAADFRELIRKGFPAPADLYCDGGCWS
jgi:hypothetical protein